MKRSLTLLFLTGLFQSMSAQFQVDDSKMEWFADAKLGIFIHWGIYSVDGISESWAFFNNYINQENYLKQLDGFDAQNYRPEEWVDLIKKSGAQYAVITSKHHDGIALWDSKAPLATTTKLHSKSKKDLLTPFVQEIKKSGLKTGLYFSLPDWSHPNYDIRTRTQNRYQIQQQPNRWDEFVAYYQFQLKELSELYSPDLLWFDGDWEHSSEEWKTVETLDILRKYNPNIIINSRLDQKGDYATPEQGIPVLRPQNNYWELCYTMNDSWGYQPLDVNYKSSNMLIRTLIDCLAMGGNLLLDIGPKADGSLPKEQITLLKDLGLWTHIYSEAIYGTRAGMGPEFIIEKNSFSKDEKQIFIYLDHKKEKLRIKGLKTYPSSVRFLGSNQDLKFYFTDGNEMMVDLKGVEFDEVASVVALDFYEKPEFDLHSPLHNSNLNQIMNQNLSDAQYQLAKGMHSGANWFKGKMNDDGSEMAADFHFGSKELQNWLKKHAEVFHHAEAGIDFHHYYGYSALSADRKTLYLFVEGKPTGPIVIKGLKSNIARIRIVGEGSMLSHQVFNKLYWSPVPGIVYIDLPEERLDENMSVIAVLLYEPIELFTEEVKAIESNF